MSYEQLINNDFFEGIAYGIGASKDGREGVYYNYRVDLATDSFERRNEMRLARLEHSANQKKPVRLKGNGFRDDVFVLFGPDISSKEAVARLSEVIEEINKNGLLVGRDAHDNDFVETVDGELQISR